MTNSQSVILVTGGCGFLGQHIVHLLQAHRSMYRIRVLDLRAKAIGVPLLEDPTSSTAERFVGVEFMVGDICDFEMVVRALKDVRVVIHCAALVDFWKHSRQEMLRVNYGGTKQLIEACLAKNVPHLVYTSTMSVVVPGHGIQDGTEDSPYPPSQGYPYLYGIYAESKALAEQHVTHVNDRLMQDMTQKFTCCSVRALCMYGENDPWQIPSLAGSAILSWVFRFGRRKAKSQTAYVRNVAWAHNLAMDKLLAKDTKVPGRVYQPVDGTPVRNYFEYMEPFMNAVGMTVTSWNTPYYFGYVIASILEGVLYCLSPLISLHTAFNRIACDIVSFNFWFKTDRAMQELGFLPLYTFKEAQQRTLAHVNAHKKLYVGGIPISWG